MKITYTIQSANRDFSVELMSNVLKAVDHYWFIPRHNEDAYRKAGAKNIILVDGKMPMKPVQLNAALDYSFSKNSYCVTMDDDYISTKVLDIVSGKKKDKNITIPEITNCIVDSLENQQEFFLGGVPSNTNPFYANDSISKKGMISGQFLIHKPQDKIRFDENITCIEDFDYVIGHHVAWGGILKHNKFLVNYHMINRGKFLKGNGVGGYDLNIRKEENLLETISYLNEKWNNPALIIEYNGFGKALHKKVKWKSLKKI